MSRRKSKVKRPFAGQTKLQQPDDIALARREAALGETLFFQGNFRSAAEHFARAVQLGPAEASYYLKLGCAAWRADDTALVEANLLKALSLQPGHPAIHEKLALWFKQRGLLERALHHSQAAMALRPGELRYTITHADLLYAAARYAAAWEVIEPIVGPPGGGPWLAWIYAKLADKVGREADALATVDRELRAPGLKPVERVRLHFAAAGLLDGLGQFDSAFEHARQANAVGLEPHDPAAHSQFVSDQIAYYTEARLNALPRATHGSRRPVLIVGMPRSGTTLVEQILASHASVFGGGELNYLRETVEAADGAECLQGQPYPTCWDHLSTSLANDLASRYLDRIAALNNTATYVTDKMPRNFLFLGTAQLLLPGCRVIHCLRDPRDTCLSCYYTDFKPGSGFRCDLFHLAQYYRDYARLMSHWKSVLDLPILDVRYEETIADPTAQTRRMLDFLELPWDERCLAFHQNTRVVTTASRDQVRRPIYSSSIGRWKHYQKHIPELLTLAAR
jgi:tetratricopeptide (TPR) repeat protein